ncbi:phosphoprotein [Wufeng Rhinolophus pearsonii tupavirus 1]|uniref:Phosphoprotein n=1 Tax=Wufeng Rhinolophus pearsonii tupavirus 1 TaxID=2877511 RepID=A0AAX2ZAH3_9RHAB|nr:phosphoprotein [Wufeng Rhinolophus pearsonii tupavirus 1]UBB42388.1 phosphoprotein [Wufeng Rhinolophus pearsonii tupavirus 1]
MSISQVSRSILSGYDLKQVESSLGECEEGVGVSVGGLQICDKGEGESAPLLENHQQRAASSSFAPFSRADHHVQIITDREDSSDDEAEQGDYGDEGDIRGCPLPSPSGGSGPTIQSDIGLEHPRELPSNLPEMSRGTGNYSDLYSGEERGKKGTKSGGVEGSILQEKCNAEILQLFDQYAPVQSNTNSQRPGSGNVGSKQDQIKESKPEAGSAGRSTNAMPPGNGQPIPTNNGGCKISFSVDDHLTAPIWTRHDQLLSLIEQLSSVGGFEAKVERDHIELIRKISSITPQTPTEVPKPKAYSITWGDFKGKLHSGFSFPLKNGPGIAVLNSGSYGLDQIQEKQIEVNSGDTELSILIKCLKLKGIYNYLARKVTFE